MVWDEMAEVEDTLGVLIDAELEIQHRLEGHDRALPECPLCRAHTMPSARLVRG
jgi:hypothetical protein